MRRTVFIALAALLAVSSASAQTPDPASLFASEADVALDGPGLTRLALPVEVTSACRPDLSDLRLVTADGTEVPYLVFSRGADGVAVGRPLRVVPEVLSASRAEERSDLGPTVYREEYLLDASELAPRAPGWELVVSVGDREFIAGIQLEVDGRPVDSGEASAVFRLAEPAAERLRLPLPRPERRVLVRLERHGDGWLAPSFVFEATPGGGLVEHAVEMEMESVVHHGDRTEAVFRRPAGLVPETLRIDSATTAFSRAITVWDEGPGAADEPLGRGTVMRLDSVVPVTVASVRVAPARAGRLRVVITNGDSPPLTELRCSARIRQPVLFFAPPPAVSRLILRYGGGRARAPRYDLERLRPLSAAGGAPGAVEPFLDPAMSRTARVDGFRPNPAFDPSPLLAFALRPGAELDQRGFSHRRRVLFGEVPEGLRQIPLTAEDLAILRPDLGDLRVVDERGRQWAYLIHRRARTVQVPCQVESESARGGSSEFVILPAVPSVRPTRLELAVEAQFFDRPYRLQGTGPGGRTETLASGRLARRQGDPRPPVIALDGRRLTELRLEVEDGDDAPLRLTGAALDLPAPELFTVAPAGEFQLLLGHPDVVPPVYELERVRATVLSVPAESVVPDGLEENPAFRATARLAGSGTRQTALLWTVLVAVVMVLGWFTLRLARQEPGSDQQD
jgi:hypothetical protein